MEGEYDKALEILEAKIDRIDEKLDVALDSLGDNKHRLKNIQFQFTRALIIRLIKWGIIAYVLYYIYVNFAGPMLSKVFDTLNVVDSQIQKYEDGQSVIQEQTKSFQDRLDSIPGLNSIINKGGEATTTNE